MANAAALPRLATVYKLLLIIVFKPVRLNNHHVFA